MTPAEVRRVESAALERLSMERELEAFTEASGLEQALAPAAQREPVAARVGAAHAAALDRAA